MLLRSRVSGQVDHAGHDDTGLRWCEVGKDLLFSLYNFLFLHNIFSYFLYFKFLNGDCGVGCWGCTLVGRLITLVLNIKFFLNA